MNSHKKQKREGKWKNVEINEFKTVELRNP